VTAERPIKGGPVPTIETLADKDPDPDIDQPPRRFSLVALGDGKNMTDEVPLGIGPGGTNWLAG
jgi:hypothetical protein